MNIPTDGTLFLTNGLNKSNAVGWETGQVTPLQFMSPPNTIPLSQLSGCNRQYIGYSVHKWLQLCVKTGSTMFPKVWIMSAIIGGFRWLYHIYCAYIRERPLQMSIILDIAFMFWRKAIVFVVKSRIRYLEIRFFNILRFFSVKVFATASWQKEFF